MPRVGDVIGKLTVLEVIQYGKGHSVLCLCSCGRKIRIPLHKLLTSDGQRRVSCGRKECDGRRRNGAKCGTRIHKGYREICIDRRWLAEHRLVVEQDLERQLTSREHVHHLNGDRLDNRIENLVVYDGAEHRKSHAELLKRVLSLTKENQELRQQIALMQYKAGQRR
jgi:hypothetical protein